MENLYRQRPWLALYPEWLPHDVESSAPNALAMFERTVRASPYAPAIHYFDATLTFGELDRASDALAVALAVRGIHAGDRVGVFLQNVPQYPIAALAIWKLGAVLVALSPMLKAHELQYQLADSGSKALIGHGDLIVECGPQARVGTALCAIVTTSELDYLGDHPIPRPLVKSKRGAVSSGEDFVGLINAYAGRKPPRVELSGEDVAMIVYTSGTTGRQKGAENTHRNVAFTSEVYRLWARLGPGDVILGSAPLFHITGLIAHLGASLNAGVPLVLSYRFDPGEALRMIERWRATFTVMAMTAFLSLMDHPDLSRRDLSSFRKAFSGGSPVSPAAVAEFERLTGIYIHNLYGLTETTSPSHAVPLGMRAPVDPESGALSVGLPIPNTIVEIVDAVRYVEAPGALGELRTKGPGIVRGYWNKPEATAETFVEGFLHTGDIGKMDAAGWFFVVDRAKDMINASGYKVWPREVEEYLLAHPTIREAAVVGVPDEYRGENVKAFVTLKPGTSATPDEIIAFAKGTMAAYKYPRTVEILPELPKTPSGKIVRRELRGRAAPKNGALAPHAV
jgi:long-chain acyl-CoA synthetase